MYDWLDTFTNYLSTDEIISLNGIVSSPIDYLPTEELNALNSASQAYTMLAPMITMAGMYCAGQLSAKTMDGLVNLIKNYSNFEEENENRRRPQAGYFTVLKSGVANLVGQTIRWSSYNGIKFASALIGGYQSNQWVASDKAKSLITNLLFPWLHQFKSVAQWLSSFENPSKQHIGIVKQYINANLTNTDGEYVAHAWTRFNQNAANWVYEAYSNLQDRLLSQGQLCFDSPKQCAFQTLKQGTSVALDHIHHLNEWIFDETLGHIPYVQNVMSANTFAYGADAAMVFMGLYATYKMSQTALSHYLGRANNTNNNTNQVNLLLQSEPHRMSITH